MLELRLRVGRTRINSVSTELMLKSYANLLIQKSAQI